MTGSSSEKIAEKILSRVKAGSIIVLHDGLNLNHGVNRKNTIEALNIIIKKLKQKGYKFVSLTELEKQTIFIYIKLLFGWYCLLIFV